LLVLWPALDQQQAVGNSAVPLFEAIDLRPVPELLRTLRMPF